MRRVPCRSSGTLRSIPTHGSLEIDEGPILIEGRRSPLTRRGPSPPPRRSSLNWEVTEEQRRALERLADYPRRVERLKLLWASFQDEGDHLAHSSLSSTRSSASHVTRHSQPSRRRHGSGNVMPSIVVGAPLTAAQIRDLMSRDITPEDYELLCLLDEGVKKAKTMSPDVAAALPKPSGTDWVNEACSICLCALEEDEDVRMLPACGHCFHAPCAERWLTAEKAACPLCGNEELKQESVVNAFKQFDENGDGIVDAEDLKKVLMSIGCGEWVSDDVDQIFKCMDMNHDGKIAVEEFVNWVFAADAQGDRRRFCETMAI